MSKASTQQNASTFTEKDREKFRKLLELANASSFEGEKGAALEAAKRLASEHGMSLEEAAGFSEPPPKDIWAERKRQNQEWADASSQAQMNETNMSAERYRYEAAKREARERGLDSEEADNKKSRSGNKRTWTSPPRSRPRKDFIRVLLRETKYDASEIAAIVGVSSNEVFKEMLLMRGAAAKK